MNKRTMTLAVIFMGLLLCIWPGVANGQAHITKAVLGTGATDKYEIINPATEFPPNTPKIHCAWKAEGLASGTSVRGVRIAEDVGTVAPKNFKIDEATFNPPAGSNAAGTFALSKPNAGFPVGKYRLEIYLGKDLAKTVPFTVKAK